MKMDTREDRVFAQFQKVCQKVWLSSKSMPDYITLKKCSTQYVAHFMWLTKSLKIGEYATICSTLYVLPLESYDKTKQTTKKSTIVMHAKSNEIFFLRAISIAYEPVVHIVCYILWHTPRFSKILSAT